jgi:WD40 repeat protein
MTNRGGTVAAIGTAAGSGHLIADLTWTQRGLLATLTSGDVTDIVELSLKVPPEPMLVLAEPRGIVGTLGGSIDGTTIVYDRGTTPGVPGFFDIMQDGVTRSIGAPGRLVGGLSMSPDGRNVVYTDSDTGEVRSLDLQTGGSSTLAFASASAARVSVDGILAYATLTTFARNQLCTLNPSGPGDTPSQR